jgi:hypothetical protein
MNLIERENIFIYAVCGRSSSTALQRILNSSEEIFIFGEHHGIIENLVNCYFSASEFNHETRAKELNKLIDCFKTKQHTSFYANATNDTRPIGEEIKKLIVNLLKPPLEYSRIGYKEINITSQLSLLRIQKFFPNSHFIFLFRNPLLQWGSVGFLKSFWDYSQSLNTFLEEYERIANIYLNTCLERAFFVEDISLKDREKVQKITKKVNLSNFDSSLIGKIISSTNKRKLTPLEKIRIFSSKAFRIYQKMKQRELL